MLVFVIWEEFFKQILSYIGIFYKASLGPNLGPNLGPKCQVLSVAR